MRTGQFSEEQILAILQQAERGNQTILALCRTHNVSGNTFYRWRSRFGKAAPGNATQSREMASENARLKRLLAERDLVEHGFAVSENDILKELRNCWQKMTRATNSLQVRREAVRYATERGLSRRRGCLLVALNRLTARYRSHGSQAASDAALAQKIKTIQALAPGAEGGSESRRTCCRSTVLDALICLSSVG